MGERIRVIQLEVSLAGESLIGCATDEHGASRRFDGRLGLLSAIDTLIGVGGIDDPGETGPPCR